MNAFEEDIQRIKGSPLKVEDHNEGERPSTANEKKDTSTPPSVTVGEEASIKPLSEAKLLMTYSSSNMRMLIKSRTEFQKKNEMQHAEKKMRCMRPWSKRGANYCCGWTD
uniref:Uncharacterized protein n=1 Tax=Haemonchus placei TaxID=6290 RepID=A0A0N4WN03_HAEPC